MEGWKVTIVVCSGRLVGVFLTALDFCLPSAQPLGPYKMSTSIADLQACSDSIKSDSFKRDLVQFCCNDVPILKGAKYWMFKVDSLVNLARDFAQGLAGFGDECMRSFNDRWPHARRCLLQIIKRLGPWR